MGLPSYSNLVSDSGAPEWTYTYEPYGTLRSQVQVGQGAPVNLMRFTGQLFDPTTGSYDLRARNYDPVGGRFLQLDPIAGYQSLPGATTYGYVLGRPTLATDPSGLWCLIHNADGGCLGGGAVDWAWQNRWKIASLTAVGVCVVASTGACLIAGGALASAKAGSSFLEYGFTGEGALNAACGVFTSWATAIPGLAASQVPGAVGLATRAAAESPGAVGSLFDEFASPGCPGAPGVAAK